MSSKLLPWTLLLIGTIIVISFQQQFDQDVYNTFSEGFWLFRTLCTMYSKARVALNKLENIWIYHRNDDGIDKLIITIMMVSMIDHDNE